MKGPSCSFQTIIRSFKLLFGTVPTKSFKNVTIYWGRPVMEMAQVWKKAFICSLIAVLFHGMCSGFYYGIYDVLSRLCISKHAFTVGTFGRCLSVIRHWNEDIGDDNIQQRKAKHSSSSGSHFWRSYGRFGGFTRHSFYPSHTSSFTVCCKPTT